jgi:hypothetical protein
VTTLKSSWFAEYLEFLEMEFDEVRRYSRTLEELLSDEGGKQAEDFKRRVAKVPFNRRDDVFDWDLDDFWHLQENIPRILRSSLFVHSYSLFEHSLDQIADFHKHRYGLSLSPSDLKAKGIFQAQMYLKRVALVPFPDNHPAWTDILSLNRIRNLIVHETGHFCEDDQQQEAIESFIKKWNGAITINHLKCFQMTEQFNERVLDTFVTFLKELFTNLKEP